MFETFDHTADLGLRIRAADLNTLFAESALALFSTFVEDLPSVKPRDTLMIAIPGTQLDFLLFDWLRELLYRFDAEHRLFSKFEVFVDEYGLKATAWGEPLDRERHQLGHEVKAITYHELKVVPDGEGWLAEIIVDI